MFDVGWSELTLLGVVALVVIGPKDLPKVLRTVGNYTRKARSIAREFQNSVDEMLREAELDGVKKQIDAVRRFDLGAEISRTVDPDGSLRQHLAPPVLPQITLDPMPATSVGARPADPAAMPTIHTPLGSEPSGAAPAGLDPHPPMQLTPPSGNSLGAPTGWEMFAAAQLKTETAASTAEPVPVGEGAGKEIAAPKVPHDG